MKILVTGAAGFIGSYVCHYLLDRGDQVLGLDNMNDYYSVGLKKARLERLQHPAFEFIEMNVAHEKQLEKIFSCHAIHKVVHLAAQAGVRYSIENPWIYMESNIHGFLSILEACRHHQIAHLVYASSSSVYGANAKLPYSVSDHVDHPMSLYAASKKSNELMAHSYAHLYQLPTTGLRFFTVYGPWGRPDMAFFMFTKNIIAGEPIKVFNHGHHSRDFTYIDDIVEGIVRVLDNPPKATPDFDYKKADPSSSADPYRIYNIGNSKPVPLLDFISAIENKLGIKAIKQLLPMQKGDVADNQADVSHLVKDVGFKPNTSIEAGIGKFIDWYRAYYQV